MNSEALDAAKKLFRDDEIIDPVGLLNDGDILTIYQDCYAFEERLREHLIEVRDPWLRSFDSFVIRPVVYCYWRLWLIFQKLESLVDLGSLSWYSSFSRIHISFVSALEQKLVEQFMYERRRSTASRRKKLVDGIQARAKVLLGSFVNRFANVFLKQVQRFPSPQGRVDILVAGMLSTDLHAQRSLVSRLRKSFGGTVAWYCYSFGNHDLSQDEKMKAGDEKGMIPVDWRSLLAWRFAAAESWSRAHLTDSLARIIDRLDMNSQYSRTSSRTTAKAIIESHEPLRLTYEVMHRLFSPLDSFVVVGNCNCGVMAFVREWARENGVSYIKLPHALEFDVNDAYEWDNQATGFLGSWFLNRIAKRFPDLTGIFRAGPVHLAEQIDLGAVDDGRGGDSGVVCLLASDTIMTDFPDSDEQQYTDILNLARQLNSYGYTFVIRCHPRGQKKWLYQKVADAAIAENISVIISDSKKSLLAELRNTSVVLMRTTSSSAVISLYQQVPLIGWLPRPSIPGSDIFLEGLPYHGISASEIAELAHKAISDPNSRMDVLSRQRDYLAQIIEDPYGDPWQRSIDVILREYEKAKREERL